MANGKGQMVSILPFKKPQFVNRLSFGILNSVVERCLEKPLTRPTTADEGAVFGHPLPKGEGCFDKTWERAEI
jgi:hypothetical protein